MYKEQHTSRRSDIEVSERQQSKVNLGKAQETFLNEKQMISTDYLVEFSSFFAKNYFYHFLLSFLLNLDHFQ